ncbi:MAG: TonB-dependent receptor [Chitinophagaceae bacterium]|nr:TonB-dependent receptor [Chitinophagaceae bacterium]
MSRFRLLLMFSMIALLTGGLVRAQETTATLNGTVYDSKGAPVPGASVVVKHEPTGYSTGTQTNNKGIFVIPNLRVGGPYTVKISFTGYKEETISDLNLVLGDNPDLNVGLKLNETALTEVVVVGGRRVQTTGGTTVGRAQLTTLPTLGRSLSDFTRLNPQSNNNSFGGSNFRYNNITLDGAMNNDAIGFSNSFGGTSGGGQSGTAGSGTRTNPYSLDVIQEVQVQLAPYDVKLGNFTGGTVNAVTKSGTNDFHGSVYGYGRNQTLVGKSPDAAKKSIGSDFYDYQYGATLSGPIIKNKLFFIANFELTRRQEPTFYNVGDAGAAMTQTQADQITAAFKAHGFDPGSYAPGKIFTNSDKYFGRVDYNISPKTVLTVRGIYTKGWGNNLERTPAVYQFSSTDFTQYSKNINIVAELKTKFSNTVNNQLILGYINVHDYRDFPGAFNNVTPYVDITNGAANIWLGTWREASIYDQKQKTFEFTDNVTWNKGIHKFTFGTHNEFYDFNYGFVNSWNGRWQYGGVDSFLIDHPSRIRAAYEPGAGKNNYDELRTNTPGSKFKVGLISVYAEDEIAVTKRFKITPGIRADYSYVGDQPVTDPALNATTEYVSPNPTYTHTPFSKFDNKWFGNVVLSPRLGFNWDVKGDKSVVVRGGTGIFTGRIPFAWLGYAYTLSGPNFNNIDYKPKAGTQVNLVGPDNLVSTIGAVSPGSIITREIDLVDNKFKLPTVWRSSVAVDYKFGHGYKATFEAMYTKTIHDVLFQQINKKDSVQYYSTGPTQTPVYVGGNLNKNFANLFLLTNTSQGWRYNITGQISKTSDMIRNGHGGGFIYNWSVAYTYGMSKDVANGIRNSMQSNWDYNPTISSNNPQLGYSNFDLRHHIVATLGGAYSWNPVHTTSLNFFYSGQSGSPYTVIYAGVPGNILNPNSALPYIPTVAESQTMITSATRDAFNAFVDADSYLKTRRGKYAERNGMRTPWNHELDLKLMHEFHLSSTNRQHTLAISLDIFNVLNLINNDWGHITFVSNLNNYTVNFLKFVKDNDGTGKAPGDPSTGYTPTFQFTQPTYGNHYYYNDPINSRWQGQLGIKYTF